MMGGNEERARHVVQQIGEAASVAKASPLLKMAPGLSSVIEAVSALCGLVLSMAQEIDRLHEKIDALR